MKALLAAALLVGTIFATTYALAANSPISSVTLGAGSASVTSCQATPVRTTFAVGAGGTLDVTVGDLDTTSSGCAGKELAVTLHLSGATDREETATVPETGSSITLAYRDVDAHDVIGVSVALSG